MTEGTYHNKIKMEDTFIEGIQELKRVDHLIFVSLKYTRSVDVIKSVISRLINAFDKIFESMLKQLKEQGKISSIPNIPVMKCKTISQVYPDDKRLNRYINFYLFLRKLDKAKYEQFFEFRRNVNMMADMGTKTVKVNIDIVSMYYKVAKEFIKYVNDTYLNINP